LDWIGKKRARCRKESSSAAAHGQHLCRLYRSLVILGANRAENPPGSENQPTPRGRGGVAATQPTGPKVSPLGKWCGEIWEASIRKDEACRSATPPSWLVLQLQSYIPCSRPGDRATEKERIRKSNDMIEQTDL
jgi:hypothetical protein